MGPMGNVSHGLAYGCRKRGEERSNPPRVAGGPHRQHGALFGCLVFGPKLIVSEVAQDR